MDDVTDSVNDSSRIPAGHAHHDRVLVARHAADDAYPAEVEQARALIQHCPDCARLAADIRSLMAATAAIAGPRRTRDFRINSEQAERLRGSRLERALRRLAAPGLAPVRPLAGVALSLGLLLAVVGAAMPAAYGDATYDAGAYDGAPMVQDQRYVTAGAEATPGMKFEPTPPAEPAAAPDWAHGPGQEYVDPLTGRVLRESGAGGEATPGEAPIAEEQMLARDTMAADMRDLLVFAGLGIALLSLGMLVLIMIARRRVHDPLLR